ncbi:MAG: ABC transporter permease [Clostridiales bacterium]|nr:ABC transporter permease [Clostridiales bacterium]
MAIGNMKKNLIKHGIILMLIYFTVVILFKWVCGTQLEYKMLIEKQFNSTNSIGELTEGTTVRQEYTSKADSLEVLSLSFATYGRVLDGQVSITVSNLTDGISYPVINVNANELTDSWRDIPIPFEISDIKGKRIAIDIEGHSPANMAPTLYYSEEVSVPSTDLFVNGQKINGELSLVKSGIYYYPLRFWYWPAVFVIAILLFCGFIYLNYCKWTGKKNRILILQSIWIRYKFLIKQLVARDFKIKYKRSILGYLWSFLNPLLTMVVQYIVFSTIFRSDIKNFPVYLLSGVVFFSFFTEAVSQGLTSIVGNASLITKVYVPKYIYPVTKVISSSINLFISLIPLLLLAIFTGAPINQTVILLVVPIACMLIFCMGLSLLLSSAMVFFRDTQYLWNVISLAWMYATPLFYPESILPDNFKVILKINPIYYIVSFVRSILIDGISPEPIKYIYCIAFSLGMLLIGSLAFKRNQNKFVLYI